MSNLFDGKKFTSAPYDDDESYRKKIENHRRFLNIKSFVLVSGLLMCAQSALSMYTKGVLTSIERQFKISSSLSGLLVGSFNVGNVLFVVLISKLCSEGSRPKSMAIGSLVTAVGGFLNAVPHAITPLYDPADLSNVSSSLDAGEISECGNSKSYIFIFAGEMLQGIGAAALVPLGSSYVDDYAKDGNSPLYIGIMLFLQNMGPGIGFLFGSFTTTLYVDFDRVNDDETPITGDDKNWVGAWWLGYIIIGILVILSSIPLFWFPKSLSSEPMGGKFSAKNGGNRKGEDETVEKFQNKKESLSKKHCEKMLYFFKSIFITVQRLLCDPLYLCVVMGYSALMFTVGTLTTFMPKFLETVFFQSKSRATFIFGMSMPIVLCLGLVSGGLIVQKAGLKTRGKMIFACVISAVTIILCTSAYLVSCDVNSEDGCFEVGLNETSCSRHLEEKCSSPCYLFVGIVSLAALLSCHIITPYYSVILSTVQPQDKSTAIGLKFLVIRVMALIPSPIITGAIIDEACVSWSTPTPCIQSSVCLQHDRNAFRYSFLHIIFTGIAFTFLFNLFGYLVQHRREKSQRKWTNRDGNIAWC